jgi:hypothetical protein
MTQIIFKSEIDNAKINALLLFLKSWGIDAEVLFSNENKQIKEVKFTDFGLALPYDYKFDREEANAR